MTVEAAPVLGQWGNAPLVFVMAQVRYLPQPEGFTEKLQQQIDALQIQKFLPAQAMPLVHVNFEVSGDGPPRTTTNTMGVAYNLIREDGCMIVRVAPDSLTVAMTRYEDSEAFRAMWFPMLGCLAGAGLMGTINRLGLRYVDFVIPQANVLPEEYVNAPWNHVNFPRFSGAKDRPSFHMSINDVEYSKGRMRLQYMRGHGQPALPAELEGLLAPPPAKMTDPFAPTAIIDTDRWMEGSWVPGDVSLVHDFKTMHSDVGSVFRSMISERAKEEWNPPKGVNTVSHSV